MKIICKKCKSTWTHPENFVGSEVSYIGEYIKKWKCPQCGHIVVYRGGAELVGGGVFGTSALGQGAIIEPESDPKMPQIVEG